jgi:hypothetical protein
LARVLALREGEPATSPETLAVVRRHLGVLETPIGSGSDCNFCEMNREQALGHFALAGSDFLFWPITPQVHAFDHLTMVENLATQAQGVQSARALRGRRPLVVSPVTLRPRFNPVATGPEPAAPEGALPSQVDPRQLSLFGAAWTLGSLAALAGFGVESITYYETSGWRGLMETETGSPLPDKFPSAPGQLFPLFQVFAAVAAFSGLAMSPVTAPLAVAALTLFDRKGRARVLAANLTDTAQPVRFVGLGNSVFKLRCLDETAAGEGFRPWSAPPSLAAGDTLGLSLPPYAVASIDAEF